MTRIPESPTHLEFPPSPFAGVDQQLRYRNAGGDHRDHLESLGYAMIFYLSALEKVPKELYEASSLDGAKGWQRFRDVTLPGVSPTTFFLSIITMVNSLQAYDQIQILTQGGPSGSTRTLLYMYYQLGFEEFQHGTGNSSGHRADPDHDSALSSAVYRIQEMGALLGRRIVMSIGKALRGSGKAVILFIFSVFTIFPFIWMIISALKTKQEIMDVSHFFPETFQWQNFVSVFTDSPLMRYVGKQFVCVRVYAGDPDRDGSDDRLRHRYSTFKGRAILFGIIMCTYMVPTAATYIPSYIILSDMQLLDTFTGLIISNCVSIFGIFLLRQAFMQVPKGLIEAARIDGASHWKILWKVVCPITKSSFITFGLMNFITCYNNYMWPSLITDSDSKMLVSQGLRKFFIEGGAYGQSGRWSWREVQ